MKVAVVTLFPELCEGIARTGVVGRALERGLWRFRTFNPRDYATDRHRTVDDRPYGGGPGMVMRVEPARRAIQAARAWLAGEGCRAVKVIYLSPQGRVFRQGDAKRLLEQDGLVFLAGRYEGVDERLIELEVDEEWSIGDYVLSGGELPAMVLVDVLVRCLPGALGHAESAAQDSFAEGLLDCPHYTRPEVYEGLRVPEVLLSGDHERIRRWRREQALERTRRRRPDLLREGGSAGSGSESAGEEVRGRR
ncbi:MAG: tRNA (guanine-N(1)-)-methyltransferase [Porticoccaceae bacterium]|nr:MAG: tRNA (guanine-N(1)-)-methyltransferase [Porticoccaceae bacterium]